MEDAERLGRLEKALARFAAIIGDVVDVTEVEELLVRWHPLDDVLAETRRERLRQDAKWGGPEHDDTHDLDYWATLIESRAGQARHESDVGEIRRLLVEAAACAVAAVESLDRLTA